MVNQLAYVVFKGVQPKMCRLTTEIIYLALYLDTEALRPNIILFITFYRVKITELLVLIMY